METLEKVKQYIKNTGCLAVTYDVGTSEILAIAAEGALDGAILAFRYGQAKGYRAAKAGARTQKQDNGLTKVGVKE